MCWTFKVNFDFNELLDYSDWERQLWYDWFQKRGNEVLKISAGPNGDGRFQTVGDLIRHIFSAEKRYVDRLCDRSLTDPSSIRTDEVDALFQFGQQSRNDLKQLVETFPAQAWDISADHTILNHSLRLTPRKIVIHVVIHEIRHWAQIATLLRLNGQVVEFHDFLFSPVLVPA